MNAQPTANIPFQRELSERIRSEFPFLEQGSLVYLDSGASAQKPRAVIERMDRFYRSGYSNIHRGVYKLSEQATEDYEQVRKRLVSFLGAASEREIVFTRGTTEAINLVAYSWGEKHLRQGDEILTTVLEHHANFVPWQLAAKRAGASVRYVGLTPEGELDLEGFERALSKRTKMVAVTQLSNGLGVAPPLERIIPLARSVGAAVLVDGAQGVCHLPERGARTGADFYVFSAHKLYGPTGVGVLYGREEMLEPLPPFLSGGDMIRSVSVRGTEFAELPARFEAGTPPIAEVLGLGAAIDYLESLGWDELFALERALHQKLEHALESIPEITVLGPKGRKMGLASFTSGTLHPHDLSQFLSGRNVCVRAGHHCAMPLLEHLKLGATTRASLGIYNTPEDIDRLEEALRAAFAFFRR